MARLYLPYVQTLNKKFRLLSHIALWVGLYILWIFIFRNRVITISRTMGIEFCYLVFIGLNYYFNIYFAIPRYLNYRQYGQFFLSGFLCIVFTSWLRAEVALYINYYLNAVPISYSHFGLLYFNSLLNIFIWTEILVAAHLILDKIGAQRHLEKIELEKTSTELDFLRAQHNPHFLFNSLNSIYFQIDKANSGARESLLKLSEMLRYQLYDCNADNIAIDKEVAFLQNYIELQKLRLNDNYIIAFSVEENTKHFEIAPLLFMPLIENAFKYVSHFTDRPNTINIKMGLHGKSLEFEAVNSYESSLDISGNNKGGIGLQNLSRRLELLYPGRHVLNISQKDPVYAVILKIDINENELHHSR